MGYGPPPGAGSQMQPAHMPQGNQYAVPPKRPSRLTTVLSGVAVLLAAAALVVSLVRKPEAQTPAQPEPAPTIAAAPAEQQLFVEDADRALCEAIAPLMKEATERNRAFGPLVPGSPEQGAALPAYKAFIQDWAVRMQHVLNDHLEPPRYLTRTLQAYIDDNLLYVELVKPGHVDSYDDDTWNQGGVDYGGPLGTCSKLGINWQ